MDDIVIRLRRACGYENVDAQVRTFQSSATNGLVLDAANEIERLRSLLRPFESEAERYGASFSDSFQPDCKNRFTVGDLRRAKAALAPAEQGVA